MNLMTSEVQKIVLHYGVKNRTILNGMMLHVHSSTASYVNMKVVLAMRRTEPVLKRRRTIYLNLKNLLKRQKKNVLVLVGHFQLLIMNGSRISL